MIQQLKIIGLVVAASLLLSACATRTGTTTSTPGPSVPAPEPSPPVLVPDEPQINAYIPPSTPELARPQPARAVQVLMSRAADQQATGNLVGAMGSLERALRIEPKNPLLWNKMAHIRMQQNQYSLARELASKSIATAGKQDRELKADNWMLISVARKSTGDMAGARAAEKRAAEFR